MQQKMLQDGTIPFQSCSRVRNDKFCSNAACAFMRTLF